MTILQFQRPLPNGSIDFPELLTELRSRADQARQAVNRARSINTCLRHFAEFLRRYYELDGAIKSAWCAIESEVRVRGSALDNERLDCIVEHLANVEICAKGPNPWLALPNFIRTRTMATATLEVLVGDLDHALAIARRVGKPKPFSISGDTR